MMIQIQMPTLGFVLLNDQPVADLRRRPPSDSPATAFRVTWRSMSSSGGSSRQRNCNACVRSKRRCDKGQPACGRCVKQRYPCVYGGRRRADMALGGSADATFSLDCRGDPNPASGTFMPTDAISTMLGTDMNLLPDATFHLNNDFSSLLAPIPGTNSFLSDSWASQFTELSSIPREKALVRKDYSKMTPMCDDYAPWQLADPSTKAAFTTESNRAMILRVLHESVTSLKTTVCNKALVPQQKLARVHALIFYQTIRMFDGDIMVPASMMYDLESQTNVFPCKQLGQQVDDDMALLESWNNDLFQVRDNLDDLAEDGKTASEHPPESWEVCSESQKNMHNVHLPTKTLGHVKEPAESSHLWNAQNSFDFFRAWKEKPFYIINTFDFEDFLKAGTGDDLDEFAFYFLTLSMMLLVARLIQRAAAMPMDTGKVLGQDDGDIGFCGNAASVAGA
ncbi:hypothetical protein CIB48_g1042 [Xylaria polymorpha]|nr:hypothetical protein CIB48_g1042 [Xylaria polymorpha]